MKRNQVHQSPHSLVTEPAEAEIQKEAYYLWLENGRPEGRDVEFWHAAREILRHRAGSHGHPVSPPVTIVHFPVKKSRPEPAAANHRDA